VLAPRGDGRRARLRATTPVLQVNATSKPARPLPNWEQHCRSGDCRWKPGTSGVARRSDTCDCCDHATAVTAAAPVGLDDLQRDHRHDRRCDLGFGLGDSPISAWYSWAYASKSVAAAADTSSAAAAATPVVRAAAAVFAAPSARRMSTKSAAAAATKSGCAIKYVIGPSLTPRLFRPNSQIGHRLAVRMDLRSHSP